jgi:predicted glycoside hydrolase/deacetylase ChbG (UPF0249 family)
MDAPARLIVNADDFGQSIAVTDGIADCLDAGVVTSTTILSNMPDTERALRMAAERSRERSFGVHLNLCEGPALTGPSTLTDASGRLRPKRAQARRALRGGLDAADVERELSAQVERVGAAGVAISHLDGHKHLHQLPGVAARIPGIAARFGVERVRCTLESGLWPPGASAGAMISRAFRKLLAARFAPILAAAELRRPARTLDLAELMAPGDAAARAERLRDPRGAVELFCHPARTEGRRGAERAFLLDGFGALLAAARVELVSYWSL